MGKSEAELKEVAAEVLGSQEILAAGLFENETPLKNRLGAFVLGDVVGDAVGGGSSSILGVAAGIVAEKAEERHVSEKEGLETVMLVAVTSDTIHVLDWKDGASTKELVVLPRVGTDVQITKSGTTRHVHLVNTEQNQDLKVWGTTSALSGKAAGDKLVTELLSGG